MLEPPEILLLGPGPSPSSQHVRRAQSKPQLGHLDPDFVPLLDYAQAGLRRLFGTENTLTLPLAVDVVRVSDTSSLEVLS